MKSTTKKTVVGTVAGLIAGVAAGVLFAPKSGKETRADLKKAADKVAKMVHDEAEELLTKAKKVRDTLSSKAKEELSKIEARVRSARTRVKNVAGNVADKKDDKELQAALQEAQEAFDHLKKFLKNAKK